MGKIHFFADATKTGLPFIRIMEGKFEGLIMMVDTGSNDNLMFGYAYNQLSDMLQPVEGKSPLYGIDGEVTEMKRTSATLSFCGTEHDMMFLVREDDKAFMRLSKEMGFPVAGIIGTRFMVEHDWMINFGNQEVVIPDHDISANDFTVLRGK